MTRTTFLRKVRKFHPTDKNGDSVFSDPTFVDGIPKGEYACPICDILMLVATGQIMGCHRWCRKEYKAMLRNMQKHEQRRAKKE